MRSKPILSVQVIFIFYPSITRRAFQAFSCHDPFEEDGSSFLRADVSIRCYTSDHDQVKMLAYIAIAIYSGAVWVLFALALARARRAIQTGAQTPLSTAIRYLHGHYERRVFYWELIELLRRLVLVGILLIAPGQGTIEQLAIGTLVAVVYLGVQAIASPFRKPSDDFFATACSMLLAALFVCSLLFKVSLHPSARF